MPERLLAIDTATETVHVALVVDGAVAVRALPGGAQASASLLPGVQDLLSEAGLRAADLDAFAFGVGPGSFTGLRTAGTAVQGLALGVGRPVLPLDTLMAVAECARQLGAGPRVWAMTDARMGEVYAALYEWRADAALHGGGSWMVLEPPALHDPAELATGIRASCGPSGSAAGAPTVDLAGGALVAYPGAFADVPCRQWPTAGPDGLALAALARRAHAGGQAVDPALALPLYVRDKVALTTAEREAARQARVVAQADGRGSP